MPDHNQHAKQSIEEILAVYSEQLQTASDPTVVPQAKDQEIKTLQETILLLNQSAPGEPDRAKAEQIKASVTAAWEKQYQPKPSLLERTKQALARPAKPAYQSATRRKQLTAVRITAAAVLVIVAAFIVLPAVGISGGETSGTATGDFGPWGLAIGVLLLIGFGIWWWFSARRK